MSEFGGLRKHEKTQHAFVGLGSTASAGAVALPSQVRRPEFPERENNVLLLLFFIKKKTDKFRLLRDYAVWDHLRNAKVFKSATPHNPHSGVPGMHKLRARTIKGSLFPSLYQVGI